MKNKRYVIDTNTLISAFLFRNSNPGKAFEKAVREGRVCADFSTFNELKESLFRSKFDKYISAENRWLSLNRLRELSIFFEISETITDCRDPKDNKFLELAVAAKASCIITGDKDLLVLHPFRDILILNAADFLKQF